MGKYSSIDMEYVQSAVLARGVHEVVLNSEEYGLQNFEVAEILYTLGYSKNNGLWRAFPFGDFRV